MLGKYPHSCLCSLLAYLVFIHAPEHIDLDAKIKPHDFCDSNTGQKLNFHPKLPISIN